MFSKLISAGTAIILIRTMAGSIYVLSETVLGFHIESPLMVPFRNTKTLGNSSVLIRLSDRLASTVIVESLHRQILGLRTSFWPHIWAMILRSGHIAAQASPDSVYSVDLQSVTFHLSYSRRKMQEMNIPTDVLLAYEYFSHKSSAKSLGTCSFRSSNLSTLRSVDYKNKTKKSIT